MALIFLIFALLTFRFLDEAGEFSTQAQSLCVQSLGNSRQGFTPALLCGTGLESVALKTSLQQWGLIHLFVVSGAHFLFLEQQLDRPLLKRIPQILKVGILATFAFATGLGPPVLRASLVLILKFLNRKGHFNWNSAQILLLAGALCVFYFPKQDHFSLQLSWAAALLISTPISLHPENLLKNALMWIGLLPLLLGLQWPHPLSIIGNTLILPAFQLFLFPLVWINHSLFNGRLNPLWDSIDLGPAFSLSTVSTPAVDSSTRWIYVACLQILSLILHKKKVP